ncbi:MAG: PIN domain-containing protein [Candidatus Lokiarchaeota archaeon]|nr:PIN domain-containing protein [Candidatus Lokiarchaeota archaeon]
MIFLDTTYLVDVLRKDGAAIEWLDSSEEEPLYTSEINTFELYTGLYRISTASRDKIQRRTEELEQILARVEVLPFERAASLTSTEILAELLSKGTPISTSDVMIAGTALSKGINRVLTRNVQHFERISLISVETY